jgi:hypothetical protein
MIKRILLVAAATVMLAPVAYAKPDPLIHYVCYHDDYHYVLLMDLFKKPYGIIKMQNQDNSSDDAMKITTFKILTSGGTGEEWTLSGGAKFSYATQGSATITLRGHAYQCEQADINE